VGCWPGEWCPVPGLVAGAGGESKREPAAAAAALQPRRRPPVLSSAPRIQSWYMELTMLAAGGGSMKPNDWMSSTLQVGDGGGGGKGQGLLALLHLTARPSWRAYWLPGLLAKFGPSLGAALTGRGQRLT
jgi:hypothetical protein